jgi:hypothetical protein
VNEKWKPVFPIANNPVLHHAGEFPKACVVIRCMKNGEVRQFLESYPYGELIKMKDVLESNRIRKGDETKKEGTEA